MKKQEYKDFVTILHSDHGSVYSSKQYNSILETYDFIHSISAPGTPTENGTMESINGWAKEELLKDLMLVNGENINDSIEKYIYYFNNERPAAALNYLTTMQYKRWLCYHLINKNSVYFLLTYARFFTIYCYTESIHKI